MDNFSVFLIVLLAIVFLPPFLIGLRYKSWKKGVVSAFSGIIISILAIILLSLAGALFGWGSGPGLGIFMAVFVLPCGYILGLVLSFIIFNSINNRKRSGGEESDRLCSTCGNPIASREQLSKVNFCHHCGAKLPTDE